MCYGEVGTTKALRSATRNAVGERIRARGRGSRYGERRAKEVGVGCQEKNTPANKSQILPHTACGTGQFFNGSGRA